ncbi:hypothetical protein ASPVEDRAFT_151418 [Aspergillus versicolor CBS 583.65]|uniref:Uncharacterized protein n=1 Tax=Aspergillus versicolor CBS 583.65 TaxID=1036611 RepID=A0A1L9PMU0_ASPVE|nr:uncharacterized protein ASPVEDRAFT_151418 [Aspergillus versicolor CBS 583.65]OJJ02821.1 hypothetical protein ASPVEDRAFT_151418 [Aspergillus versicolor CBS 583.65]
MKPTTALFLTLSLIAGTTFAEKTCTPSFDYCADELIDSKGFTKDDLKSSLKGSEYEDADPMSILYHCTNPGAIGHPKLCKDGCKGSGSEGSKSC